jgi:hypothetical protein
MGGHAMRTTIHEHETLEFALTPFYKAKAGQASVIQIPDWPFLMIDGQGDPNTSMAYKDAVEALYSVSYTLKFDFKHHGVEYKVAPLEGLWWSENMLEFNRARKDLWQWTMMIAQPKEVTPEHVRIALNEVWHKKKLPGVENMRLEHFHEGLAAQVLYVGPYASETISILAVHAFIRKQNGHFDGRVQKHHEIYLTDPNRTAPEKSRTIIRQPFTLG